MKKEKLPSLISILILTLVTTIVWVSLNVYRSFSKEQDPSVPKEVSEPITPTLDQSTMNNIKNKIFLDDSQIPQNRTPMPLNIPTPTPEATELPTI